MSSVLRLLLLSLLGGSLCLAVDIADQIDLRGTNSYMQPTVSSKKLQDDDDALDKMLEIKDKRENGITVGGKAYEIYIDDGLFKVLEGSDTLQNELLGHINRIQRTKKISEDVVGYEFTLFQGKVYVAGYLGENAPFG